MAIYSAVPPPPEYTSAPADPPQADTATTTTVSLASHVGMTTSATGIDIDAWTISALQSLSVSPVARGTGTPLAIPIDDHDHVLKADDGDAGAVAVDQHVLAVDQFDLTDRHVARLVTVPGGVQRLPVADIGPAHVGRHHRGVVGIELEQTSRRFDPHIGADDSKFERRIDPASPDDSINGDICALRDIKPANHQHPLRLRAFRRPATRNIG